MLLGTIALQAQSQYIHTNGMYILGPCGDTLLLRGLNYAPYNWGYDINSLQLDQIVQSGANIVRMDWYWNNPDPNAIVYQNYTALNNAISQCVQNKMIAVLEIHDYTCSTDTVGLFNLHTWWTQSNVFTILQQYKESVIVNYANEALYYQFAANPVTALATYKNTYQNIITALRSVSGFNFPIMIDAPDCGTNSDAFITSNVANDLIQADPLHNIIFSAHAYWYAFANNDSAQMAGKINAVLAQNIPFVLGEVSNLQDDVNPCAYVLNYKPLLNYCQLKKVNWLAWSWDNDVCPTRQISSNGNFNSLTTYGNDIIHNPGYGLLTVSAPKSQFLLNGCNAGIENRDPDNGLSLYPNPASTNVTIETKVYLKAETYRIIDPSGRILLSGILSGKKTTIDLSGIPEGIYLFQLGDLNKQTLKVIKH